MDPIAVDIRLIRGVLAPELRIAPGRALMARVVAADGLGRGALSIAGVVIDAKLPGHLRTGDELRLVVRHVSPEQVVLGLSDPALAVPVPAAVALPGGGTVRALEDENPAQPGQPGDVHTLSLRYDAPALGAVDLRFVLDPASLTVAVAVAPGQTHERARDAAGQLRAELAGSVDRDVTVTVAARREPLDLYA